MFWVRGSRKDQYGIANPILLPVKKSVQSRIRAADCPLSIFIFCLYPPPFSPVVSKRLLLGNGALKRRQVPWPNDIEARHDEIASQALRSVD